MQIVCKKHGQKLTNTERYLLRNFRSRQMGRADFELFLSLLFFAAYVICTKNYSFSRVVFLFFQSKIADSFYSKINDSSRVRTTAFSSSRFGVRLSVVPNIFTIYPQYFLVPEINETLKSFFTKFFGTVRQKISDGKL